MAEAWAYLNGVELFNQARTIEYIRNGLAGTNLSAVDCACDSLAVDLDGNTDTYASPAADPAPWYSSSDPASGEFLGFLVRIEGLDSTLTRTVTSTAGRRGGGKLSVLRPKERTVVVHGHTVAASDRGQEFGMRWLIARLAEGINCDDCDLDELMVQTSCPPSGSAVCEARWTLRDVGVLEGPKFPEGAGGGDCAELRPFDLTLVSEHAYLYSACTPGGTGSFQTFSLPASCTSFCSWWSDVVAVRTAMTPTSAVEDMAAVVTVVAGTRPASFDVTVADGTCPPSSSVRRARIPFCAVPAGSTTVIDSTRETITTTLADGAVVDGFKYVVLDEDVPFEWMTLGCTYGQSSCVSVEARVMGVHYDTQAKIEVVRRRL